MATGALDHAGRDRPAVLERGRVVEVGAFGEQVVGAAVGGLALVGLELEGGGFAADRGGDDPCPAFEYLSCFVTHSPTVRCGWVTFLEEAPAS